MLFIFDGSVELVSQKYCEMTPKLNDFLYVVFHINWITENRRHTTHKERAIQQRATRDLTLPLWAVV